MKPGTHTVQQLFVRYVRYVVPLYQRPYVWDESHQWEPLWEDILALLQHQEGSAGPACGRTSSVRSCSNRNRWLQGRSRTSPSSTDSNG
jgi:hypothetical protein